LILLPNHSFFDDEQSAILHDDAEAFILKSIAGTGNAEQLAGFINCFCIEHFDSRVLACHFARLSMGASFGLKLENGKYIFLKISQLRSKVSENRGYSVEELLAKSRVQEALYHTGFPCPAVILHPVAYHDAIYTVNAFADIGIQKDAHDPMIRRASAHGLAELIKRLNPPTTLDGFNEVDIYQLDSIFPAPHNPLVDFSRNAEEAKWIDEIACKSKQLITGINKNVVLGYCDWSMKNMRFIDNAIAMVYDWDSIILQDEYHMLATAASTYPMTWDIPVKIVPTQEEAYAFVLEYEQARGKKFSKKEWTKISACVTYYFCYTARCQVSSGDEYEGSFIEAIRNMNGNNYLRV